MSIVAQELQLKVGLQGGADTRRDFSAVVDEFRNGSKQVSESVKGTGAAARGLQQSADRAAAALGQGAAQARHTKTQFGGVSDAAKTLRNDLERVAAAGSRTGDVFKGALGAGLVAQALANAAQAAKEFVFGSAGAVLQGQRIARGLEFAAGSAEQGAAEFRFVRDEAERLGMQLATSAQDFSKLSAASRGTALQGRVTREIFTGVSEAATVLGLRADETSGALNAIQQMMSKGSVQAEELRGQLGERIPGAFDMAARAMKVNTEQLNDMLVRGEVLAVDFLPRFARELHKTYGAAAVTAAKEGQAGIHRFRTALFELSAAFGGGFMSGVSVGLERLRSLFKDDTFRSKVKSFGETLGAALTAVTNNFDGLLVAGKAFLAMFATSKLMAIVTGIRAMGAAMAAVVAANPLLAAITVVVGAATVAWHQASKASKTWHDEIKEGEALLRKYNPQLDNLENRLAKLHEKAMASNVFADIEPDAGNKSNRDAINEDQKKTLLQLKNEIARIRAEMLVDGEDAFDRKRKMEVTRYKQALVDMGTFGKGLAAEKEKHQLLMANIDAKIRADLDANSEKANKAFRDKQKADALEDEELTKKKYEAQDALRNMRETLLGDSYSRERAQADAHYAEMSEAINAYVKDETEKENMLTALREKHAEARRKIDMQAAAAQVDSAGQVATNVLKAWDSLYSGAKKNAMLHKSLAIGMILIDTARAVMATLKDGGFWAMPMALSVGALGAAQAYKVSQQKFAQGGIVQGSQTTGDRIPVRVNAREMILTQAQQANLWGLVNGHGGSPRGGNNSWDIQYAPSYNFYGSGSVASPDIMRILRAQPQAFGDWFMKDVVERGYVRMAA